MLIVFWQFTIKTLNELDIVSNQHLSIEMFLIRLIHLVSSNSKTDSKNTTLESFQKDKDQKIISSQNMNNDAVSQIKNVAQEFFRFFIHIRFYEAGEVLVFVDVSSYVI